MDCCNNCCIVVLISPDNCGIVDDFANAHSTILLLVFLSLLRCDIIAFKLVQCVVYQWCMQKMN